MEARREKGKSFWERMLGGKVSLSDNTHVAVLVEFKDEDGTKCFLRFSCSLVVTKLLK